MAFISKNPKLSTTTLVDQTSGAVTSPPSGSNKVINRNGILYLKSSAGVETPLGSGASAKNYLSAVNDGSAAAVLATVTAAGNVVVSGAFPNVTSDWGKDTTSSIATSTDNSLRGTSNYLTAAGASSASGATFVQTPAFNIDGEDLGKVLAVQFDVSGNTTANDWDVIAVRYTSAGVFGELIPIAGIASTTTGTASAQVPTGTTTFKGFFITGSTASDVYSLRWRRRAGTVQIRLDNLIVGPNSVMMGTAITDWKTETGLTYTGFGTVTIQSVKTKVIGDSVSFRGNFTSGNAGAFPATIILPAGMTLDVAKISTTAGVAIFGWGAALSSAGTANYTGAGNPLAVVYDGTNADRVALSDFVSAYSFAVRNGNNICIDGSADIVSFEFTIPVVGKSSNVTMADRAVEEYASNSSATDANEPSTLFVNGPAGSVGVIGVTILTATRIKRVRFQTPIQQTDSITLEFQDNTNSGWVPVASFRYGMIYTEQNTGSYGSGIQQVNSTDVDVKFGQYAYANGATFGAAGVNWSSAVGTLGLKAWRVRKVSGGAAVGFPVSAENLLIAHNSVQNQNVLLSGTYTPTATNVTNVAASTAQITMFTRVGSVVSVTGFINVDVTLAATASEFRITLPIASNLTLASDLQGVGSHGQVGLYASARFSADTTNDAASCSWFSGPDTANRELSFSFTYLVK